MKINDKNEKVSKYLTFCYHLHEMGEAKKI